MPMCEICGKDKGRSEFNQDRFFIETESEEKVLICRECE